MKFKIGDFVRFVDEKLEGYVTRIIDENMIGVTGEDDFEIPVLVSKVTLVHGQFKQENEEEQASPQATARPPAEFKARGLYLAVAPDPRKTSIVYFHLINETSFKILFSLTTEKDKETKGEFAGIIEPGAMAKVYSASLNELSLWPKFTFQALYHSLHNYKIQDPLVKLERFKAKDFSGAQKQVKVLNQQAWLIRLDEEEIIIDPEKLKESFFKPAEEKKEIEKPAQEIDLHIEKLRDDYQFLNKADILNIQLEYFKKSLDAAIVHKMPSVIFVHGLGNGTLRYEIHKTVSKHPQVKTFADARKEKFGYGATEVFFK
jgi:DNA-nicking Smr family endonuclease